MSKCATPVDDKKRNGGEQKSESRSNMTVVLSDDDKTDDFDSVADTSCAHSSQLDTSALQDGGDNGQHNKPFFPTANVSSPPLSINSQSSVSLAKLSLNWPASSVQTTGIKHFVTDNAVYVVILMMFCWFVENKH